MRALEGSVPLLEGRSFVGRPRPWDRLEVAVHLRHRRELPPLAELCAQPRRQPMSRTELRDRHGAAPEDVAAVEAFARRYDLSIAGIR